MASTMLYFTGSFVRNFSSFCICWSVILAENNLFCLCGGVLVDVGPLSLRWIDGNEKLELDVVDGLLKLCLTLFTKPVKRLGLIGFRAGGLGAGGGGNGTGTEECSFPDRGGDLDLILVRLVPVLLASKSFTK
jgi:hypothetical protein